jgi:pyruvate dehydrogenase E2 component (dihydrolipoamide acetyltransferase)
MKTEKIIVLAETPNDEYVTVSNIFFNDGEFIKKGDKIFAIETTKAIVEMESPFSGYINIQCEEGQEVEIGECIALITKNFQVNLYKDTKNSKLLTPTNKSIQSKKENIFYSKKAQVLVTKNEISDEVFSNKDFVKELDVLNHLGIKEKTLESGFESIESNTIGFPQDTSSKKLSQNKIAEIQNLTAGQNKIISNVSVIVNLPDKFFKKNENTGAFSSLTNSLTPIALINICRALKKYKEFNAFYENDVIHFHNKVNVGYVLDLGEGINVVNLGDVENDNIIFIAEMIIKKVINSTRGKKEVVNKIGSTFTVTDLSAENVHSFVPLINKFQSAILGIGTIDKNTNSFLITLAFDHRVTEGRKASLFLNFIKKSMEKDLINLQ